jgi:hypothetical protein
MLCVDGDPNNNNMEPQRDANISVKNYDAVSKTR